MIIPFTILLGTVGYFFYKSKDEVHLVDIDQLDSSREEKDDDLYQDLEDLFI